MGEAKRRKKLDPTFGVVSRKVKEAADEFIVKKQAELQARAIEEMQRWESMKAELAGIKRLGANTPYQKARMMLYESLLPLENNPEAEIKEEVVREAGLILFESEGMKGLYDRLLWLFIPKSCNRIIDILWDGIGEWRA